MTCLGLHNAETDAVNPITAFWKLSALLDNGPFNYICRPFSFRSHRWTFHKLWPIMEGLPIFFTPSCLFRKEFRINLL